MDEHNETDESQDDGIESNLEDIEINPNDAIQNNERINQLWKDIKKASIPERKTSILLAYQNTLNKAKTLNFEFAGQSFR